MQMLQPTEEPRKTRDAMIITKMIADFADVADELGNLLEPFHFAMAGNAMLSAELEAMAKESTGDQKKELERLYDLADQIADQLVVIRHGSDQE
jgi:hypothetical protein